MSKSPDQQLEDSAPTNVGGTSRMVISIGLLLYLSIVVLGPLSNPISSAHLTDPLSRIVAPVHQTMFLGHGYRFFGPDPGPSHILEFKIKKADMSLVEGHFPDREVHWPRLRYHRWFMLSETIYEESVGLIDENQHEEILANMNAEIEVLRMQNELPAMNQLVRQRNESEESYQFLKRRLQALLQQLADYLLRKHSGQSVEIFLRERLIARPVDVQSRIRLTDTRFLSEPNSLGVFTASRSGEIEVLE